LTRLETDLTYKAAAQKRYYLQAGTLVFPSDRTGARAIVLEVVRAAPKMGGIFSGPFTQCDDCSGLGIIHEPYF